MSGTCNILGIVGSLRRESYNRSAMRAATQLVPQGARIEVFDLDGIPPSTRTTSTARPRRSWSSSGGSAPPTRCCS